LDLHDNLAIIAVLFCQNTAIDWHWLSFFRGSHFAVIAFLFCQNDGAGLGETYFVHESGETTYDVPGGSEPTATAGAAGAAGGDVGGGAEARGGAAAVSRSTGETYYIHEGGDTTYDRPASAAAPAEGEGGLPPGWTAAVSRSMGETYYVRTATGATTYARPVADDQGYGGAAGGAELWEKLFDEATGAAYYLDRATGEQTWERPEALVARGRRARSGARMGSGDAGQDADAAAAPQYIARPLAQTWSGERTPSLRGDEAAPQPAAGEEAAPSGDAGGDPSPPARPTASSPLACCGRRCRRSSMVSATYK
jgi:hypothetical protein